ncbi:MAG TPA: amidohydrolase family protein [Flavobacteriales bacterium]
MNNGKSGNGGRNGQLPVRLAVLLLGVGLALVAPAQRPTPAPAQARSILVKGGTVHVGDGRSIVDGAVGFRKGVIDFVGYSYGVTAAYDTVIDATGKHIYPGFILPDITLGLVELDAVRASSDEREVGDLEPEVRTITAYNTDSKVIPTVRNNGVLLAQIVPRGGALSGTSSVVQLDAWEPEEAVVRRDDGTHMNWPPSFDRRGWWAEPDATAKREEDQRGLRIETLRRLFLRAKAYASPEKVTEVDLRLEALKPLFDGSRTLFVHADRGREIQEAVLFAKEMGVQRTVIVGGYDAWRVADLLRDRKVDVILLRSHSLPLRTDDPVDLPYRLPALLKERGVRFCLSYTGDMERMGSRNLAFVAGTASTYGLGREEALRSITLDAAAILGIDQRYGSLEAGKSATLFISTGDALDMRTNNVEHAFIDGRKLSLDDTQKQLYRQYRERYAKP